MNKQFTSFGVAFAVAATSLIASAAYSAANAATFTTQERINRNVCYRAKRVPATVEYNTKGRLLRGASRNWVGNMQADGARVVDQFNDEVYFTTRRVVEDQHMTLVQVPCR